MVYILGLLPNVYILALGMECVINLLSSIDVRQTKSSLLTHIMDDMGGPDPQVHMVNVNICVMT